MRFTQLRIPERHIPPNLSFRRKPESGGFYIKDTCNIHNTEYIAIFSILGQAGIADCLRTVGVGIVSIPTSCTSEN